MAVLKARCRDTGPRERKTIDERPEMRDRKRAVREV